MDEHQKRLVDYVNRQVSLGVDKDIIIKALRDIGWPQDRIDASFASLNESRVGNRLPGPANLFVRAWGIFKSRVGVLLALSFMSLAANVIGQLPEVFRASPLATLLTVFVSIILSFLTGAAIVYAVANHEAKINVGEAYSKAAQNFWGFALVSFLVGLLIGGGFGLLIIPGVMFIAWFSLAVWVFVVEGTKGMNALLKSREYARGLFWPIFGRLVLLVLVPWVAILAVLGLSFLTPILALIAIPLFILLSFVYPPLASAYIYLLYKDIKALKGGDVQYVSTPGRKAKFIIMGAVGLILLMAIPLGLTIIAINPSDTLAKARDTQRISDLSSLKTAISIYQSEFPNDMCGDRTSGSSAAGTTAVDGTGWVPVNFEKLLGGSPIAQLPSDPLENSLHYYYFICSRETQKYELDAFLETTQFADMEANDGGNNPNVYEKGTDLYLADW